MSGTADNTDTDLDTGTAEDRGDDFRPEPDDADPAAGGDDAATGDGDDAATGATAAGKPRPNSTHVPIERFNEVNTKKNTLAQQLEDANRELERFRGAAASAPAPVAAPASQGEPEFDEGQKEAQYTQALMDGDQELAVKIRREINAHIRTEARREAQAAVSTDNAARALQSASDEAIEQFPYLNTPDGAEALELIVASRNHRIAQGAAPAAALRAAVKAIAPRFAPPSTGLPADEGKTDTRAINAAARGAQDSLNQPPALVGGTGNRANAPSKVDVSTLTEEQFAALPEAEKKRLRGD